jgi:Ca2+-transporting ATPase
MIMDGPPAVALGLDPARDEVMEEPPRDPKEMLLTLRRVGQALVFGTIMMIGTLSVLYFDLKVSNNEHASTLAFTTFVLFQVFNVFNARSENMSAFNSGMFENRMLWVSLIGILSLQTAAIYWTPATEIFQTTALSAQDWGVAFAVASSILVLEEMRKATVRIGSRLRGA